MTYIGCAMFVVKPLAGRNLCRSSETEWSDYDADDCGVRRGGEPVVMRILVIEDDRSVGAAIQMILVREGYETVHAPDASIGMEFFESSQFDLVIIDIFMRGVNGLTTIARFRQQAPAVPILAMSGFRFRDSMHPDLDFLAMAAKAGAAVCLRKPFAPPQLLAAVSESLDTVLPAFAS
jgi:DNA-binding response OmpR family regulator